MEIESKYIASGAMFTELLKAEALGHYRLGETEERRVIDHYMDTSHLNIWKGGYACRMREKDGKWLLTVKGLGGTEGAIHQREEYEMEIQPGTLPQQWPDGPARELVISLAHSQPLVELCVIRQLRSVRMVDRGQRRVGAMSLDIVDMESAGGVQRTHEVEVELEQNGTLADLRALDEILQDYGLSPEPRSKFERAMDHLRESIQDDL